MRAMRRTAIQITLVLLLGIGLCGPIFQNLDPWDSFPDTGDNFVLVLAAASVWFGLTLCVALLIPLLLQQARTARPLLVSALRLNTGRLLLLVSRPIDSLAPLRL
jgi:hypothetical protein